MNPNELSSLANHEVKNNSSYLPKGLHQVKMTSYDFVEPKGGCPYLSFTVKDENDRQATLRLYREREGDKPEVIAFKRDKLKQLLEAAGADFKIKDPGKFMNTALNNPFQIVLRDEEFIGYNGELNNKPEVRTMVKYVFAEPIVNQFGEQIEVNVQDKYTFKPLQEDDRKRFEFELSEWKSKNGDNDSPKKESNTSSKQEKEIEDDDLPF